MDILIGVNDNKCIVNYDELKNAHRLEGATIFKRIFKIEQKIKRPLNSSTTKMSPLSVDTSLESRRRELSKTSSTDYKGPVLAEIDLSGG